METEVDFDEPTHTYSVAGKSKVSVTQVIRGVGWMENPFMRDGYQNRGTLIHRLCHFRWKGTLDPATVDPSLAPFLKGFDRFLQLQNVKIRDMEKRVYDPTYDFAGTIDIDALVNGEPAVIDIKAGSPSWWHAYQTAGYSIAAGTRDAMRFTLHLFEHGKFNTVHHTDKNKRPNHKDDLAGFLSALYVYRVNLLHGVRT